jgi:hypothetical protein
MHNCLALIGHEVVEHEFAENDHWSRQWKFFEVLKVLVVKRRVVSTLRAFPTRIWIAELLHVLFLSQIYPLTIIAWFTELMGSQTNYRPRSFLHSSPPKEKRQSYQYEKQEQEPHRQVMLLFMIFH